MMNLDIQEITLQVGKYQAQAIMNHEMIPVANLEHYVERTWENVHMRILAHVAQEDLIVIKYPANWKEALKERWFTQRLLKKYPVKYIQYDAKCLYPSISLPDRQPVIKFFKTNLGGN